MILVVCVLLVYYVSAAKPVYLFHGVNDDYKTLDTLATRIRNDFPDTFVHSIQMYPHYKSLLPLQMQSEGLRKYLETFNTSEPFTIIGHSQGALTLRHMIQNWEGHNISTFISVVGPHMGVSKIPPQGSQDYHWLPNSTIAELCYNRVGQETSLCNMWNDPTRKDMYIDHNKFLSGSLCQTKYPSKKCSEQADNLKRLDRLVLLGTPDDGTIYPFESTLFEYYDSDWEIVSRRKQPFYQTLGLADLESNGRIFQCVKGGVDHQAMVFNEEVYRDCIKPFIS